MIRAVLDANVLVSSLIRRAGPPGLIMQRFAEGDFEVVLSGAILDELRRALGYRKVRRYVPLSDEELELWIVCLEILAIPVDPTIEDFNVVPKNPDDEIYIAAALEGGADFIVTGDRHLLELGEYGGIRIVRPSSFLHEQEARET